MHWFKFFCKFFKIKISTIFTSKLTKCWKILTSFSTQSLLKVKQVVSHFINPLRFYQILNNGKSDTEMLICYPEKGFSNNLTGTCSKKPSFKF